MNIPLEAMEEPVLYVLLLLYMNYIMHCTDTHRYVPLHHRDGSDAVAAQGEPQVTLHTVYSPSKRQCDLHCIPVTTWSTNDFCTTDRISTCIPMQHFDETPGSSDFCAKQMFQACMCMQNACERSSSLVGVGMMDVVLDPPGLKGVYEGSKHESAHNVLYQLILAEGTVPTVVTHHKELHTHNNPDAASSHLLKTHVPLTSLLLPTKNAMFWCLTRCATI